MLTNVKLKVAKATQENFNKHKMSDTSLHMEHYKDP